VGSTLHPPTPDPPRRALFPGLTRPEAPLINMRARIFSYPVFSGIFINSSDSGNVQPGAL